MRKFTRGITPKFTEADFLRLQSLAAGDGKPVATWCREVLLALANGPAPSPFQLGVMAEITATQAILIDLLCTVGRDGKITTQKAQQIVDAAHNNKYKEALELLRFAHSKAAKFHLEFPVPSDASTKGGAHD